MSLPLSNYCQHYFFLKDLLKDTAERLNGTERRQFMAQVVQGLGVGGQAQAKRDLGWNRGTIRKGLHELAHGPIRDTFDNGVGSRPKHDSHSY